MHKYILHIGTVYIVYNCIHKQCIMHFGYIDVNFGYIFQFILVLQVKLYLFDLEFLFERRYDVSSSSFSAFCVPEELMILLFDRYAPESHLRLHRFHQLPILSNSVEIDKLDEHEPGLEDRNAEWLLKYSSHHLQDQVHDNGFRWRYFGSGPLIFPKCQLKKY